jgi:hypothetical protein
MKPLILAAIVLALLWRSRRKPGRPHPTYGSYDRSRPYFESDDGVLPVDPYTWTMA